MKTIIILIALSIQSMALIFPIVSFSDETGTMLGLFWQKKLSERSNLQLFGLTQNKGNTGFLNASNVPIGSDIYNFRVFGSNAGSSYYGIGNTAKKTDPQHLYYDEFSITSTIERPWINQWNLIIGLNAMHYSEQRKKNNNQQAFPSLSKLGLIIGAELDKRNKEFNSTNGYFNEISLQLYDNQTILSNDIRRFTPIPYGVIATKLYSSQTFTTHDHIKFLSSVGNYNYLRGYKTNDIMDRHLSFVQLEWRAPVFKWLIITPFIEGGVIGRHPGNLKKSLLSYGLGHYIPIGEGSFRIELATAESNSEFYFGFNHVF